MSIEIDEIKSGYNLSKINSNFKKVVDELANKLSRKGVVVGDDNVMYESLDLNGQQIINVAVDSLNPNSVVNFGYVDDTFLRKDGGTIGGSLVINNNLQVKGDLTVNKLIFDETISTYNQLTVNDNLDVKGTAAFFQPITATDVTGSGAASFASLSVSGASALQGVTATTVDATGNSTFSGSLVAGSLESSGNTLADSLNVTNAANLGSLTVVGGTSLKTLSTTNTASLNSLEVPTTMSVTGVSTLTTANATTLNVTGATTLGETTLTGEIDVIGNVRADSIVNSGLTKTDTLNVIAGTNCVDIVSTGVSTLPTVNATTLNATGVTTLGLLNTTDEASIESLVVTNGTALKTLSTTNTASLNSATITTTLGVTGNSTFSTLTSTGLATLNSISSSGNISAGTLGVTGLSTLASANLSGTLTVTGNSTLSTVTTTGLATVNSLDVSGISRISSLSDTVSGTRVASLASNGNTISGTTTNSAVISSGSCSITDSTNSAVLASNASDISADKSAIVASEVSKVLAPVSLVQSSSGAVLRGLRSTLYGRNIVETLNNTFSMGYSGTGITDDTLRQNISIRLNPVNGIGYFNGGTQSSGADFAELFDNGTGEVAGRGKIMTIKGGKAVYPTDKDDMIVGVVSTNPSLIGNAHSEEWSGRYETDEFGDKIVEGIDDEGNNIYKQNPSYDPKQPYTPRTERPLEWVCIGMVGQVPTVVSSDVVAGDYIDALGNKSATKTKLFCIRKLSDTVAMCLIN